MTAAIAVFLLVRLSARNAAAVGLLPQGQQCARRLSHLSQVHIFVVAAHRLADRKLSNRHSRHSQRPFGGLSYQTLRRYQRSLS